MPESLENQFISDLYTSLLHLSGAELSSNLNKVFDGAGNSTGLALSGERVVISNYIYPQGFTTRAPLEWLDSFYPIGSIQLTITPDNPTNRIAGTEWVQVAQGRFLVGTGTLTDKNGDTREFCPGGEEEEALGLRGGNGDTAGEYLTTLTQNNLPAHTHDVNIGALDVQVPASAGTNLSFQAPGVGITDATFTFGEQQRARLSLARKVYASPGEYDSQYLINYRDASFQDNSLAYPWLYALDFDFNRGSAANYSAAVRSSYITNWATNYQFKEMIGIWNGETRFVSDSNVQIGRSHGLARLQSSGIAPPVTLTKTPYEYALELGAVDIGDATAGNFLKQNSNVPVVTAPTDVINRDESVNNTRVSASVGRNIAHNNIPPSYGVYVWKRIS